MSDTTLLLVAGAIAAFFLFRNNRTVRSVATSFAARLDALGRDEFDQEVKQMVRKHNAKKRIIDFREALGADQDPKS